MSAYTVDLDWLKRVREDIIDPGQRIIDPHHHFGQRPLQVPQMLGGIVFIIICLKIFGKIQAQDIM